MKQGLLANIEIRGFHRYGRVSILLAEYRIQRFARGWIRGSWFRSVATGVAETRLESARLLECLRFCFTIAGIWNVW